jgi:hypothetical protein
MASDKTQKKGRKYTGHNTPETKTETYSRCGFLPSETNEDSIDGNPSSRKSKNLLQYSYMVL